VLPRAMRVSPRALVLVALLFASCNPLRGCVESYFELQTDCRLPRWFSVPAGMTRTDVKVTLSFVTGLFGLDNMVTRLEDSHGRTLATVTGRSCPHPEGDAVQRNESGGFSGETPRYTIMVTQDAFEVFDFRDKSKGVRVSDDPAVVTQASDKVRRGECRQEAQDARAETNYTLAPESRLPGWFHSPEGSSRSSLTVSYASYAGGSKYVFRLWDVRGNRIAEVTALDIRTHPDTLQRMGGTDDRYPHYWVVAANGVTEVLEYRKVEPLFYVSDDPVLRDEAGIKR
jgi:hypothetical protein